jgi:hypothetical protein
MTPKVEAKQQLRTPKYEATMTMPNKKPRKLALGELPQIDLDLKDAKLDYYRAQVFILT